MKRAFLAIGYIVGLLFAALGIWALVDAIEAPKTDVGAITSGIIGVFGAGATFAGLLLFGTCLAIEFASRK